MQIYRHLAALSDAARHAVAALGNFDGVHLGHQQVLEEAGKQARNLGAPLAAFTFFPHPREWFDPGCRPLSIYPLSKKLALLREYGVEILYLLRFDERLSRVPADLFLSDVLAKSLDVRHVVTGENFAFGHARSGNTEIIRKYAPALGFGYTQVPHVAGVSSSRIRECLKKGDVQEASSLLGRPYAVTGRVRRGDGRGERLGIPTANLSLATIFKPAFGVYAVRARLAGGEWMEGVANCGIRPTFGGEEPVLEVHCFGVRPKIYGNRLEVHLIRYLRPERKFADAETLVAQIRQDMMAAKATLAEEYGQ